MMIAMQIVVNVPVITHRTQEKLIFILKIIQSYALTTFIYIQLWALIQDVF